MVVPLSKFGTVSGTPGLAGGGPSPDLDAFRRHIVGRVFDSYCDAATWRAVIAHGMQACGLDQKTAELAAEMELETLSVANEVALLKQMEGMLRQFTERDKKLDAKERADLVQMICRAKPGFAKGLRHDIAESFITDFCRQNGVKVKVGLFRWAIP